MITSDWLTGRRGLVLALTTLLFACSDATAPVTLSADAAAEMYVQATLQPYLLAVPLVGQANGPVNKTAPCSAAGSFTVTGTATSPLNLSARFTGCQAVKFVIDGSITLEGTIDQSAANLNWHGFLELTGPTTGECWVDIVLSFTSATQSLSGTVCGADAQDLKDAAKKAGLTG
ncbi:MAG TPA: hypothetical protein VGI83_02635 [Gemmatimonadales bacterium]